MAVSPRWRHYRRRLRDNESPSVALPASGIVAGDHLVILVGTKPTTATINTPSGWTKLGELASSKGVSADHDVGDTKIAALGKGRRRLRERNLGHRLDYLGQHVLGALNRALSNGTGRGDIDVATGRTPPGHRVVRHDVSRPPGALRHCGLRDGPGASRPTCRPRASSGMPTW